MFWHHTFIYSTSWEDYDVDRLYMHYKKSDNVLTLTGGGCNAIHVAMHGANVYCVDMNHAQNHLLELKLMCAMHSYEALWNAFGSGHECCDDALMTLSDDAQTFWKSKKHYFSPHKPLYCHGGMGLIINIVRRMNWNITLRQQQNIVDMLCNSRLLKFLCNVRIVFLKKWLLWYICGIPRKQYNLIVQHDKRTLFEYLQRILNVFVTIPIHDNHYYYLCTHGRYSKGCCPAYLREGNYDIVKSCVENVHIFTDTFINVLRQRTYTKVILMDHMDWLSNEECAQLVYVLNRSVVHKGRILLRSASLKPPYIDLLEKNGFAMSLINSHSTHTVCDKVNMYASTYIGTKRT